MAEQDNDRAQATVKEFERMKELAQGMTAQQATHTTQRLSKWANSNHAQWKDINKEISKEIIKAIWPCEDGEIRLDGRCPSAKINKSRIIQSKSILKFLDTPPQC